MSVVKSALVTEGPDRESNILNNKTRDETLFSIALKKKKENSKLTRNGEPVTTDRRGQK